MFEHSPFKSVKINASHLTRLTAGDFCRPSGNYLLCLESIRTEWQCKVNYYLSRLGELPLGCLVVTMNYPDKNA